MKICIFLHIWNFFHNIVLCTITVFNNLCIFCSTCIRSVVFFPFCFVIFAAFKPTYMLHINGIFWQILHICIYIHNFIFWHIFVKKICYKLVSVAVCMLFAFHWFVFVVIYLLLQYLLFSIYINHKLLCFLLSSFVIIYLDNVIISVFFCLTGF